MTTLAELAMSLGGSVKGEWINIPGPGHSKVDDSLGIIFDQTAPDGFGINSWAGDDPATCRKYVRSLLRDVAEGRPLTITPPNPTSESDEALRRTHNALAIWSQAVSPRNTPVEGYLRMRDCWLSPVQLKADAIRYHPGCPFGTGYRFPAMIALMRDAVTNEPMGVHRTALADDGNGKRIMPDGMQPRMMMGPSKGTVVKLHAASTRLAIAEGVETALSAALLFGVPVWAVLSATGIRKFPVLPEVRRLIIFADHDEVGLSAGIECGERFARAGIHAEVQYPDVLNSDWNDHLAQRSW